MAPTPPNPPAPSGPAQTAPTGALARSLAARGVTPSAQLPAAQAPPPGATATRATHAAAFGAAAQPPSQHILPSAEIELLIRARYPLLYIMSWEEERIMRVFDDIATRLTKRFFSWSITRGLMAVRSAINPNADGKPGTKDPIVLLRELRDFTEPAIVVLKDFHHYLKDSAVVRGLRELAQALRQTYVTVIILAPVLELPRDLEKDVTVLDFPLPTRLELHALLESIREEINGSGMHYRITDDAAEVEALLGAAVGLTLTEAENVFAKALTLTGRLSAAEAPFVYAEKKQIVLKSGLLEYVDVESNLGEVGGLEPLKDWLVTRRLAFTDEATAFGLPAPRGVLILGVQGCGKSLCAKAVAQHWNMPLMRLDMGRLFSSYIGDSESNVRRAIKLSESMSPVVLWIDEIDKGLAGLRSGGSSDSGTTQRVFGTIITWLQEKKAPVFVIATANQIDSLPPELMRKGRFDEIFFVDLPTATERRQIFSIHLAKRRRNPDNYNLDLLAQHSESMSGAEIESAIIAALFEAYAHQQEISTEHLLGALRASVPLAVTMREEIERLRNWARSRARPASLPDGAAPPSRLA